MNKLNCFLRFCAFALLFLCVTGLSAQSVAIDLPFHPGRKLVLSLKNGTRNDTIFSGNLDDKGQVVVSIPKQYKSYRGMAALRPEHPGAYFEFIIAGEDMILKCEEEYPHGGNVTFSGSPENEALQRWFTGQAKRQQKIGMLSELLRLYDNTDKLFPLMEEEKTGLEAEQAAFEKELTGSNLYAARFIGLHNFLNRDIAPLVFADSAGMAKTRRYITDNLDVQSLYTSGLWFDVLNGSLALYDIKAPFHYEFVNDMSKVLNRADDKVYNHLAENLFAICESTGWNDLEEQLAYFLINDGRIKQPTGKLKLLMSLYKLNAGSKAPGLSQGVLPKSKTLLVFHETGCGNCTTELQQLKDNYPLLKEKGYEVVSVSADMNRETFDNTSASFPWKQKHCDLQGISGTDFRNFGILGTPTIYLIDENGIVQGRYARLQDTGIITK